MNPETFDEKMASVLSRLDGLTDRRDTGQPTPPVEELLTELSAALEELHIADEELREKNQELATAVLRYQELFEFAPDAYLKTDLNGMIREANRAAAALFGLPIRELLGKPFLSFVARDWRRRARQMLNHMAMGQELRDQDLLIQAPHTRPTACACSVMPLRDTGNQLFRLLWLVRDIGERKALEETLKSDNTRLDRAVSERTLELEQANLRLRSLTQSVVMVQEEERRRVSRELHDEAGQALTALKMNLEVLREDVPSELPQIKERLGELVSLITGTIEEIRALAQALRPPALDAADINIVLEGVCRQFARGGRLAIYYVGTALPSLPEPESITLYRFLQEALTNIVKHAQATEVHVTLDSDAEEIVLSVQDNGRGFDSGGKLLTLKPDKIGLMGMQERLKAVGGWFEIDSKPGKGARLAGHIPHKEAE